MHLRFNFDACPMHSPSGFVHLTHQNLSARALFCLNSLAKVNTQLLIYNYYYFFFFIAEKVNKAHQQYSGCQKHNFLVCNLRRFLNGIIPWSGVKVMVLWVMNGKNKVGHFRHYLEGGHSSLTLHTYSVCLLFDSINAFQVRVSSIALHWTGPSWKLIGSEK